MQTRHMSVLQDLHIRREARVFAALELIKPITWFPLEVRHVSFDYDQGFYYGGGEGCGDGKIKVGSAVFTSLLPLSGNQEFSKIIDSLEIYLLFRLQRKMKQEMD